MGAQDLLDRLLAEGDQWPPKLDNGAWATVGRCRAFRDGDTETLRQIARFERPDGTDRGYFCDPMPEKIATTYANLIFGENPDFTAAADQDQDRLDELVSENGLPSELQLAADMCVSEGEVWWRWLIDPAQADVPLLRWHSRSQVLALFRGRKPVAAGFVFDIDRTDEKVWRLVEIHGDGVVLNVLFEGTTSTLGIRVALEARSETADLLDGWSHGLPMLAGRVVNKLGRNPRLGVSDFKGVEDYLLALNETATIGQENARMTLKRRVVVPQRFLNTDGTFPAGAEVIVATDTDTDPDKPGQGLAQIEWSFDAQAFISYKQELEATIAARVGLVPQIMGLSGVNTTDGNAASGTSIRLRFLTSTLAAEGKARHWDDSLPYALELGQRLAALPVKQGGLGQAWTEPLVAPAVERQGALPEDLTEEATRHAVLIGAEVESRQTAVESMRPDWDEERVLEELRRIESDRDLSGGVLPPGGSSDEPSLIAETS